MLKKALVILILSSLFVSSSAFADGIDLPGFSWSTCINTSESGTDQDLDGLRDDCEVAVVSAFQPELVFHWLEGSAERRPYWTMKQGKHHQVVAFYALAYYKDKGKWTLHDHLGDTEFIVLLVSYTEGENWVLDSAFLSAHWEVEYTDSSAWYDYDEFAYADSKYRGRPQVWIAKNKHANYPNYELCEKGAYYLDNCSRNNNLSPLFDGQDPSSRNLGLLNQPNKPEQQFHTSVTLTGENAETLTEWFWLPSSKEDDRRFCGWEVPDGESRDNCVPDDNSYHRELTTFEMAWGPQGNQSFCELCETYSDCQLGGLCLPDSAGIMTCRQECDGLSCPNGSSCITDTFGAVQCELPASLSCEAYLSPSDVCGDDQITGTEQCDGDLLNGETCQSQNFDTAKVNYFKYLAKLLSQASCKVARG